MNDLISTKNQQPNYLTNYLDWLKSNSFSVPINDSVTRISLPLLDPHNDYVELYIIKSDKGYTVTDYGDTIETLIDDRCITAKMLSTPNFTRLLLSFGITINAQNHLSVSSSSLENLWVKKHFLIQAIMKMNDIYYKSPLIKNENFVNTVKLYFDSKDISYNNDVLFSGKSGLPFQFDFALPKRNTKKQRLVSTINNLTKDSSIKSLFYYKDISDIRSDCDFLVIYNDNNTNAKKDDFVTSFANYTVPLIPYNKMDDYISLLN